MLLLLISPYPTTNIAINTKFIGIALLCPVVHGFGFQDPLCLRTIRQLACCCHTAHMIQSIHSWNIDIDAMHKSQYHIIVVETRIANSFPVTLAKPISDVFDINASTIPSLLDSDAYINAVRPRYTNQSQMQSSSVNNFQLFVSN